MKYTKRWIRATLAAALALGVPSGWAQQKFMPLDEITPGMRGVARTVFAGSDVQEFELEIINILPNFSAKRDLILARLIGDTVEKTGVVAGMSGSPVYVDGRLIGAISYSMGVFLKEPIAGITPIEQMTEIYEREKVWNQEMAYGRGFNPNFLDMAMGVKALDWQHFIPPGLQRLRERRAAPGWIQPLSVPLIFSGFLPEMVRFAGDLFDGLGFEIMQGGGVTGTSNPETDFADLQPGSAFSLVLVDGDFGLQATGTVTHRDGGRILGMGHPVFDNGAVDLPLGKARVITTVPSLMFSTKITALSEVVGTIHQDRTTGLLGILGEEPGMIPVYLTYRSEFQSPVQYSFRLADDRSIYSFTPLILRIVLGNALRSARLAAADQTLRLDGKIVLENHEDITLENYYAGGLPETFLTDALEATGDLAAVLGALLSNEFEVPRIEAIKLNFHALPKKRLATIQRVEVEKTVVQPGDELSIRAVLKEYQGEEVFIDRTLKIPETVSSKVVTVFVGSGDTLTQLERRTKPQKFKPNTFQQLIELLDQRPKKNELYVQLYVRDSGLMVETEELPTLPPSVLSVMNTRRATGDIVALRSRVLVEDKTQLDYSVLGGKTVRLRVKPKDE